MLRAATAPCQRWRLHRTSYRPAGEPIEPSRYGVELLDEAPARTFVTSHHYSGSYPAARCRVGLYRTRPTAPAELVGVAVFSVPCNVATIAKWTGLDGASGVELGRFVLLDDVPGNGETWFLRRAFEALRDAKPAVRAVVAYSDPMERRTAEGHVVKPGHVGTIYQAHNGRHLGTSRAQPLWIAPSGVTVSGRAMSKVRLQERGAAYSERQLVALGARARKAHECPKSWLADVLATGPFRRLRHPGNYVYAWPLDRRVVMPAGMAYPKGQGALL